MPWRLIGLILLLALVVVFIGFNLDNSCDVSFGFYTMTAVPIYLSVLGAFALGMLMVLPLTFRRRIVRQKKNIADVKKEGEKAVVPQVLDAAIPEKRRRGGLLKKASQAEQSPYGID